MKRILPFVLLYFSYQYLFMESGLAKIDSQFDFQGLEKRVFIGQAYPSGNIYLECFNGKTDCQSLWPKELLILPLGDTKSVLAKTQIKASFVKIMKDEQEDNVTKSIYIPGAEGMNDDHESCGPGEIKKVKLYKYISDPPRDYFDAMSDHCEPNEGVGIYHAAPTEYSFLVLGIDSAIAVANLKLLSGKRPLSPADQQEIAKKKREDKKMASDCTGDPTYIDSAIQIAEVSLAEGDFRLRVSTYDSAGCDGHLSSIYILDVLQRNVALRRFDVYRYQGAL